MKRATLVLLLLLAAPPAHALPEETWLVVVGNNGGDGDDGGLLYAERDARELADVFRTVGRVSSPRISLLLDESADTVRHAIVDINARLRAEVTAGRPPAALVVFYSGHADAMALHLGGTRLPFDELRSLVESSSAAIRLLIVDACRSGSVTRVKGVMPVAEFEIDQVGVGGPIATEGMAIVTSSAAGESSQESDRRRLRPGPPDGLPRSRRQRPPRSGRAVHGSGPAAARLSPGDAAAALQLRAELI